ncbi:MAG: FAD-binding protein [Alphaproteobacteria bacterium]|nr:FAD-binding protein [Alphaproteobacteria bacterium]
MISRRKFLKILGGTTAFVSVGIPSFVQTAYARSMITMTDFGGLIVKRVAGIVDQVNVAQEAIKKGDIIHPRGMGHSNMGQSMREGAYVFSPEPQDIRMEGNLVVASAGTTLLEIDNFLLPKGLTLPVSPDHRSLSLGGVLSVGGF